MTADLWWYYFWAVLLVMANAAAWTTTLLALPGNWVMVALNALFAAYIVRPQGGGLSWLVVGATAGLAALGELIEIIAGAAGVARQGGSQRGMMLAVLGAMAGSLAGAFAGVPIPLAGPIIGIVGGGMCGAFAGAFLGETWKGRSAQASLNISWAALVGRVCGTIGKLAAGVVILMLTAVAVFAS